MLEGEINLITFPTLYLAKFQASFHNPLKLKKKKKNWENKSYILSKLKLVMLRCNTVQLALRG